MKEDSKIKLIDEASNDLGKPFTSQSTKKIRFTNEMKVHHFRMRTPGEI